MAATKFPVVPPVFRPQSSGGPKQLIQRRTIITGNTIEQFERKGTPWTAASHGNVARRSKQLADQVDAFKKQMLTDIANAVRSVLLHMDGTLNVPHVAVIISGPVCHLAINNVDRTPDVRENIGLHMRTSAQYHLSTLRVRFGQMQARYQSQQAAQALSADDRISEEALYIALRWVSKVTSVKVQPVNAPIFGGAVHGEMQILQNEFQVPDAWVREESRMAVLRVGGTKTPCFDCAHAMGVHNLPSFPVSDMRFVKTAGNSNRRVWTMGNEFGPGFRNWTDPADPDTFREDSFNPRWIPGQPGYHRDQDQSAEQLRAEVERVRANYPYNLRIRDGKPL